MKSLDGVLVKKANQKETFTNAQIEDIAKCTDEIKAKLDECEDDNETLLVCTDKIKDSLKECVDDIKSTKKCTKKIKKKVYKSYDFLKDDVAEFIEE